MISTSAHADGFLELDGELAIPISNNDWTRFAGTSPELGMRIGSGHNVGGFASIDWTPVSVTDPPFTTLSVNRFRIQGGVYVHDHIAPRILLEGRFSAGVDIIRGSTTIDLGALGKVSGSNTDTGFALEPGVALWFEVGSLQVGGQFALPIGIHSTQGKANDPNNPKVDYTAVDINLVGAVRFGF